MLCYDFGESMDYAGFWRRFWAGLIDFLVFVPLLVVAIWVASWSLVDRAIVELFLVFLFPAYSIYLHGRFGQTLGKMTMRIRVISEDGNPLSWRQAFFRNSVDIVLGVFRAVLIFVAISQISRAEYSALSWIEQGKKIDELTPYSQAFEILTNIWACSEVVVMLTNTKRKAVHDFLAGSVVVHSKPQQL